MPEAFSQALATPGLIWMCAACFVGGVVRGFSGFGTALVVLPVFTQFLAPVEAIVIAVLMDIFGPLPVIRQSIRDARLSDVGRMYLGMILAVPVGLSLLFLLSPEIFRYCVSIIALVLLFCLVLGLRFEAEMSRRMLYTIGAMSGFSGGFAGVPGPPMILVYMASRLPVRLIRANATLFLYGFDVVILSSMAVLGKLTLSIAFIGLLISIPVLLGNFAGAAMFRPKYERYYRAIAYFLIAASAISGLPVWDK